MLLTAQNPTIIITGGVRFLGAALARRLARRKAQLYILDNLSVGNYQSIRDITRHKHVTFINCDISEGIPRALPKASYVFHLAGTHPHGRYHTPATLYDLHSNSTGTQHLLEYAKMSGARFVYASTLQLYESSALQSHTDTTTYLDVKRFGEGLVQQYAKEHLVDARTVRIPQIYGPGMNLELDAPMGKMIAEMLEGESIQLPEDGLAKKHYLYIDDAIEGLVKTMYAAEKHAKNITVPLFSSEKITAFTIEKELQKLIEKEIPVKTSQKDAQEESLHKLIITNKAAQQAIDWTAQTTLPEGLAQTLKNINTFTPTDELPQVAKETNNKRSSRRNYRPRRKKTPEKNVRIKSHKATAKRQRLYTKRAMVGLALLLLLYSVFAPPISTLYHLSNAVENLNKSRDALATLKFEKGEEYAAEAEVSFQHVEQNIRKLQGIANILGQGSVAEGLERTATAGRLVSNSAQHAARGIGPVTETILASTPTILVGNTDAKGLTPEILQTALAETAQAHTTALLAKAELKSVDKSALPQRLRSQIEIVTADVTALENILEASVQIVEVLPTIMGFNQEQVYLVLLQNSHELRPTGGFIGSYAEARVRDGIVTSVKIDDIYNPDGALIEKDIVIEPPAPIKDVLGQPRWFLRDSNWDASFPEAAEDIRRFYTLETGTSLDGVFAIDLFFIEKLLEVTGPLTIAAYGEEISSENLYEKAELYSEAAYQEGANYKKAFLATLGQALIESLIQLEPTQYSLLANSVTEALSEKHLLINSTVPSVQAILDVQNWDGSLQHTTGDYLAVIDANLGANKANYYVTKTTNYDVATQDRQGTLTSTLNITYIHTGTSDAWPGGQYTNYVRVFTPPGSTLRSVSQRNSATPEETKERTEEITTGSEAGKTVFAGLITLAPGQSTTVTYTYELPQYLAITPDVEVYNLLVQKQPGTDKDPFVVSFETPFGRTVNDLPEGTEQTGSRIRYNQPLTQDISLSLQLE